MHNFHSLWPIKYNRLPIGLKCAPDAAQECMKQIFRDLQPDTEVYIDDIGCFSNNCDAHIELLHKVCNRLSENRFTVDPLKCEWGVE